MRIERGGDVISLAPDLDTQKVADIARIKIQDLIAQKVDIVADPQHVRDHEADHIALYIEVKQYAVALVHSLDHRPEEISEFQGKLKVVGNQVLKELGLEKTHEVRAGSDAVEIVAKGVTPLDRSRLILAEDIPESEVDRMFKEGLHKGTGIHNFMALSAFADRTPYVVGDSGTDGVAMVEATKYGGGGVWVLNGNSIESIKPAHKAAVSGRYIEKHEITWDHIGEAVAHLQEVQKVYRSAAVSSGGQSLQMAAAMPNRGPSN
jgi:hypothetical protein